MKKRLLIFSTLAFLGGLVTWMWQDSSHIKNVKSLTTDFKPARNPASASKRSSEIKSEFEKRLALETTRIAQIDVDPAQTENDLRTWARSFTMDQLSSLQKRALSEEISQDERFLDVLLLGWSENPEAQDLLEGIALDPIDDFLSPGRMGDFERVLRMKAVESLADLKMDSATLHSSLEKIISRSNETHIVDRAQRSLWASKGLAHSPATQDDEAFTRLLERN